MFCNGLEVHLLPILIWFAVGDITISTVLWENTRPVITFSVAGKESEMRLLASLAVARSLLSVFPVKSSVSCRYLSRMWFSKRVTKSLLSSMAHNLSLSKICVRFFLLGGWEQNINASVWVTLSAPMAMVAINHKWFSKARLLKWCAAKQAILQ